MTGYYIKKEINEELCLEHNTVWNRNLTIKHKEANCLENFEICTLRRMQNIIWHIYCIYVVYGTLRNIEVLGKTGERRNTEMHKEKEGNLVKTYVKKFLIGNIKEGKKGKKDNNCR